MFHTFESFENPSGLVQPQGQPDRRNSVGRRVTTLRACTSCRHRKIKCDGEKPCEACRWYKKADLCHYSDPRPSRRHVEKLSTTLDEYRSILERLFPNTAPELLVSLTREKLLELSRKEPSQSQAQAMRPVSPATSVSIEPHLSPKSPEDGNLESLQTMPDHTSDGQNLTTGETANGVSDDVNALALSARQPSSYLGISSIHAVLKVIVWLDPGSLPYFYPTPATAPRRDSVMDYSSSPSSHWQVPGARPNPATPPQSHKPVSDVQLLDAYFTYVQPFVPMLDEQAFRETYFSGRRRDDRWLALLNIVFALGSITACPADDVSHDAYYIRCKSYLNLDSLGSSHLETIQTLGLLGGYYLHYTSQPNLAYSLMGAALRMAAALGLHKEFSEVQGEVSRQRLVSMDLKRRVWWSLFCLDTWGAMTLGRPSMGRLGPTITVKLPNHRETGNVLDILPLLENVRFCKIATQIQEVLAVAPLTKYHEIAHLDNQLTEWYDNLPYILKYHEPCSESLLVTRTVMKWRFYNQRMLLYRPTLLSYAMRRVPYIALRSEERMAIEKCREIAETTIQDIAATAQSHQMSGWNAVWLIFQATMVPLVGLFLNDNTADDPRASPESCQTQVEMAIHALSRLHLWSPAAKKTLDAVSRILEASQRGPDLVSDSGNLVDENCPVSREAAVTGLVPTALPSQPDFSRGVMITNDNAFPDPFAPPFVDDSTSQYLWDFLSWGDSNLMPGVDNAIDPMLFCQEEKGLKYGSGGAAFFGMQMMDSAGYFGNPGTFYGQ